MWNYPALVIGTSILLNKVQPGGKAALFRKASAITAVITSLLILPVNYIPYGNYEFNNSGKFLLENFPDFYNPYYAVFYQRNSGYSYPYDLECPEGYFSEKDGSLRKLLIKSNEKYKQEVLSSVEGDEISMERFAEKLNALPNDNSFHYVNISPQSGITIKAANEHSGR